MNIQIREVESNTVLPIRQKVLRVGKALEFCKMPGDDDNSTIHLGLYFNNVLAGIATLMIDDHPDFSFKNSQLRLRGMAVLPDYQKKQLGNLLLEKAIEIAKSQNYKILWFNAREIAVGFYQKFGFSVKGNVFMIEDVGPHFLMYKSL